MDFEGLKLLFCVAAFGWIVYMAFKQKMHKMDPKSFKFLVLIFGGLLLAFICFLIPGGANNICILTYGHDVVQPDTFYYLCNVFTYQFSTFHDTEL